MKCEEHEKGELSDHLFENFIFFKKKFRFVVNFVNSCKLETQHDVQKFTHIIETPPNKSEI